MKPFEGGSGPYQVYVNVRETAARYGNRGYLQVNLSMCLGSLTGKAFAGPGGDLFSQPRPYEMARDESAGGSHAWVGRVA